MERIHEIEDCAFEIVKLLQGRDRAFESWAIGRAIEVLETQKRVETMDDYRAARKSILLKEN